MTRSATESTSLLEESPPELREREGDAGLRAQQDAKKAGPPHQYGALTAYAVTVNYIVGAGVLGLPNAFFQAGIALTWITICFFFFFSVLGCWWVVESLSRAHGVLDYREAAPALDASPAPSTPSTTPVELGDTKPEGTEDVEAKSTEGTEAETKGTEGTATLSPEAETRREPDLVLEINSRRHVTFFTMCELFSGNVLKIVCDLLIILYCYGTLWAYVATFSSSLAALIFKYAVGGDQVCDIYVEDPTIECQGTYWGCIALFALLAIPLTLIGISEQQGLQLFLTFYRFLVFALMIITVGIGLARGKSVAAPAPRLWDGDGSGGGGGGAAESSIAFINYWGFRFSGFWMMFPTAAYSTNVHYNLPDSITPCRDKHRLRLVTALAQTTSLVFYLIIGTMCAAFFDPPQPLITLSWNSYTGCGNGWAETDVTHWWAVAVQLIVVLFPVLDLANVYPLVSLTLAGNIEPLLVHVRRRWGKRVSLPVAKLLACVPPFIVGALFGKVDIIFTLTGLCGFFLQYVFPPVFQWISVRYITKRWGAEKAKTSASGWWSHMGWVVATLVVGFSAWAYSFFATGYEIIIKPLMNRE